jgi:DNA-binding HxlR family transcriptional regulator
MKSDPKRSYDQWCAVARALDLLGERWTLLIVRDLLVGPKRYTDLLDGLPGIGTNLLARRLRELEEYGVLERTTLPAPASAVVYALTAKGLALEPVVFALGRWGFEFLGKPKPTDAMLPDPFFVSLRASFDPRRDPDLRERYAFRIGRRIFEVVIADGNLTAREGGPTSADVTFTTDAATLFALRRRELRASDAIARGQVQVQGDPAALDRFVSAIAWSEEMLKQSSTRPSR